MSRTLGRGLLAGLVLLVSGAMVSRLWIAKPKVKELGSLAQPVVAAAPQEEAIQREAPIPAEALVDSSSSSPAEQKPPSLDEAFLFFPSKYPDGGDWNPPGLKFEDVWFESEDKTKLHGWYCPTRQPRATILICHGNAGNIATWGT